MQTATAEKIFEEPIEDTEENIEKQKGIFFDKYEWKNFMQEIKDMYTEGKEIDFEKAMRNARYLAIIDRGIEQMNKGNGHAVTDEELRGMIDAENIS